MNMVSPTTWVVKKVGNGFGSVRGNTGYKWGWVNMGEGYVDSGKGWGIRIRYVREEEGLKQVSSAERIVR